MIIEDTGAFACSQFALKGVRNFEHTLEPRALVALSRSGRQVVRRVSAENLSMAGGDAKNLKGPVAKW